jgi:hypothetical protein
MLRILLDLNYVGMLNRLFPPGMLDTTYYLLCGRIQLPSWMMTAHGRMYTRIGTVIPTVILISRQHTFFPAGMILVAWLFGDIQQQGYWTEKKNPRNREVVQTVNESTTDDTVKKHSPISSSDSFASLSDSPVISDTDSFGTCSIYFCILGIGCTYSWFYNPILSSSYNCPNLLLRLLPSISFYDYRGRYDRITKDGHLLDPNTT